MNVSALLCACVGLPGLATAANLLTKAGEYQSPSQECTATIEIAEMGGFAQLSITAVGVKKVPKPIDDITGFAWIDSKTFVYSASYTYGTPGLFVGTCEKNKPFRTKLIDRPKNVSRGYPKGADYYELESIEGREIRYYYAPYQYAINFRLFRQPWHLKSITLEPIAEGLADDDLAGLVPGSSRYVYVLDNPAMQRDVSRVSGIFDGGTGTVSVTFGEGGSVTYPAGNNVVNPESDPIAFGKRGAAPSGTWPVQLPISTQGNQELGPYFWPIGNRDEKGSGPDIAGRRGIGIHGGRSDFRSKTDGSIRMNNEDILDLFRRARNEPLTKITIR